MATKKPLKMKVRRWRPNQLDPESCHACDTRMRDRQHFTPKQVYVSPRIAQRDMFILTIGVTKMGVCRLCLTDLALLIKEEIHVG